MVLKLGNIACGVWPTHFCSFCERYYLGRRRNPGIILGKWLEEEEDAASRRNILVRGVWADFNKGQLKSASLGLSKTTSSISAGMSLICLPIVESDSSTFAISFAACGRSILLTIAVHAGNITVSAIVRRVWSLGRYLGQEIASLQHLLWHFCSLHHHLLFSAVLTFKWIK